MTPSKQHADREALRQWLDTQGIHSTSPTLLDALLTLLRGLYDQPPKEHP